MDLTYFVALGLALVIGLVAAVIFVARQGQSKRRLLAWAVLVSAIADFVLLIDWSYVGEYPLWILAIDLFFFAIYGFVGCALGALPVLLLRKLLRKDD